MKQSAILVKQTPLKSKLPTKQQLKRKFDAVTPASSGIPVTSVDWWLLWLETKSPDPRIGAVRAILEAFQSSLLDRKAANDLLITYLRAEAVVLTAWEKILDCVLTRGIALSSEGRLGDIVDRES